MTNDPLDSFVANRPTAPNADDMPSVTVEADTSKISAASRKEPKLGDTLAAASSGNAHSNTKPAASDKGAAQQRLEAAASSSQAGSKPAATERAESPAGSKRHLKRRTRFAIYLGFMAGALLFIAVAGNAMLNSVDSWNTTAAAAASL